MLEWVKHLLLGKRLARKKHTFVTEELKEYLITQYEAEVETQKIAKDTSLSVSTVNRYKKQWKTSKEAKTDEM